MIREVKPKDFPTIYQLGKNIHPQYENLYNLEELTKETYFHLIVYEIDKQVVAFLSYTNILETVEILDIYVDENYRLQKVATNLIDYLITGLTPNINIYLEVKTTNTPALNLYKKFGFQAINTRKNYYDDSDAYVMKRVI